MLWTKLSAVAAKQCHGSDISTSQTYQYQPLEEDMLLAGTSFNSVSQKDNLRLNIPKKTFYSWLRSNLWLSTETFQEAAQMSRKARRSLWIALRTKIAD